MFDQRKELEIIKADCPLCTVPRILCPSGHNSGFLLLHVGKQEFVAVGICCSAEIKGGRRTSFSSIAMLHLIVAQPFSAQQKNEHF